MTYTWIYIIDEKMKKLLLTCILGLFSFSGLQAQMLQRLQSAPAEDRREMIRNLSPEERRKLMMQLRENMMIEELEIKNEDREQFKKLYGEYQSSQRQIKNRFNTDFDPDKLTDDEARQKLDESFVLGQQLIQNRKAYAEKMQSVMRPRQVLKMFQNEGMMRDKMMDRRMDLRLREDSAGRTQSAAAGRQGFRTGHSR